MAQGNYDHPSYITRVAFPMDVSTAGANGTSATVSFISDMRIRKMSAVVRVAGTSATTGNQAIAIYIGTAVTGFSGTALTTSTTTATLGTIALSSSVAGTVGTSTDMNARLVAGGVLAIKNGTDATGTFKVTMEMNLDPGAQWTGPPGA